MEAEKIKRAIKKARLVFAAYLALSVVLALLTYSMAPALDIDAGTDFPVMINLFGAVGVLSLAIGFILPWLLLRNSERSPEKAGSIFIMQYGLFFSISGYGTILSILGVGWTITLPFFIIALMAFLRTRPTEERVRRISGVSGASSPETG